MPLLDILIVALTDTLPVLPVLFVLYVVLELAARGGSLRLARLARRADTAGPVAGALLGVIPQCGMSVFMTSMFLAGKISRGTLVATYIATSDEALPVLIAHGHQGRLIGMLVGTKIVAGIAAGLLVDLVWRQPRHEVAPYPAARDVPEVERTLTRADVLALGRHALGRTLQIFGWVFAVTLLFGLALAWLGPSTLLGGFTGSPWLGVVVTAVFGLIPNCAASIAIAESAVRGLLPFGATLAGLSAGAGFGPITLLKDGSVRDAVQLLGVCLVFSILLGFAFTAAGM